MQNVMRDYEGARKSLDTLIDYRNDLNMWYDKENAARMYSIFACTYLNDMAFTDNALEKAKEFLDKAFEFNPDYALAAILRAWVDYREENIDSVINLIKGFE